MWPNCDFKAQLGRIVFVEFSCIRVCMSYYQIKCVSEICIYKHRILEGVWPNCDFEAQLGRTAFFEFC